jgi:hypothetical protein
MSNALFASIDFGPPRKTGDDWYYAPRPAESLDAAEVKIVVGPEPVAEREEGDDGK